MKKLILITVVLGLITSFAYSQVTTPISPSGLPLSTGVPGVVQPASTDATSSTVIAQPDYIINGTLNSGGSSISLPIKGRNGASVVLGSGLTGTVFVDISYDNELTWISQGAVFYNYSLTLGTSSGIVYSMPATGGFSRSIAFPNGVTHLRLTCTLSGTSATFVLSTTNTLANPFITAYGMVDVVANDPPMAIRIGGIDGIGGFRSPHVKSAAHANTDYGLVTRNIPINNEDKHLTISFNESVAAPTAATWYVKRRQAPIGGLTWRPLSAHSVVTTAGSQTFIGICLSMGTFNTSTNVFTDGSAGTSSVWYSRLFAVVNTALSAASTNVTVTYTDQNNNTGHTTSALTIAASAPVGNAFEFVLAATTGQERDSGIRDITAVSDSANPTGVIEFWACNPIMHTLGVANAFESTSFRDYKMTSPETLMIILQQAATTAQLRGASIIMSVR